MKIALTIIICSAVIISSCKSKKAATSLSASNTAAAPATATESIRLVVSFYSIGSGIDLKTNDEFVKFLDSYPKKISYEPTHWGREGEIDYCLALTELSQSEQNNFVKKAKEILEKSSRVHVNENAACVHKH